MNIDVTLSDVAKAAGVSLAAASRALNGKEGVRADVRARVRLVADGLGYRPNRAAKNLAGGRAMVFGLLLGAGDVHANIYASSLIQGFIRAAEAKDEGLMIVGDSKSPSDAARDLVRDGLIDGVVISSVALGDQWAEELIDSNIPTVLIGGHPRRSDVCVVDVENTHSSSTIVGHMLDTGCKRVAMLAGVEGRVDSSLRVDGYRLAHSSRQIPIDPALQFVGNFDRKSAYDLADEILKARPDAVFCANDEMALGLHIAFKERGIAVPEDISLAGFDNSAASQFGNPDLTSVVYPFDQIALSAVEALKSFHEGATPTGIAITPEFHWGTTTHQLKPRSRRTRAATTIATNLAGPHQRSLRPPEAQVLHELSTNPNP